MRRNAAKNSAATDSPQVSVLSNDADLAYSMRGSILFTQAAIVLLAAILVPCRPAAIDLLMAANLIFTAMLLFVVIFAREPAAITAIPPVIVFITLLRLFTNVVAAKSVLMFAYGGRILDWCGEKIYYGLITVIIALFIVLLVSVIICKAANFIRQKAVSYLTETIPSRQSTLQAEFQTGTINYEQMLRTKKRIEKQIKFFAQMASTSSLLLCDGVLAFIITASMLFGASALNFFNGGTVIAVSHQYPPLAIAIAANTAIPAVLISLAIRLLINRRFLIMLKVKSPIMHFSISSDFVRPGQASASETLADTPIETIEPPKISLPSEQLEKPAVRQKIIELPQRTKIEEKNVPFVAIRDDYYYDCILATIGEKSKAAILLAGQNASQLPVTIAVELVIHIIQARKKCLLIDMDQTRNAVTTAFDIDASQMMGKAVPTGIENFWISPAEDPKNQAAAKLSRKISNALKVFDYVVIYAPNTDDEIIRKQLAGVSDTAVIFDDAAESPNIKELEKELAAGGGRILFEKDLLKKMPESIPSQANQTPKSIFD